MKTNLKANKDLNKIAYANLQEIEFQLMSNTM